jgi:hypothetical protein
MSLIELRRFTGRTLDEVTRYLSVDVSKSFADLFAQLTLPRRVPAVHQRTGSDVSVSGSGVAARLLTIELPKGSWHITAQVYAVKATATLGALDIWLTQQPAAGGGSPAGDAVAGYNRARVDDDDSVHLNFSLSCHWYLELQAPKTIHLAGKADYGSGTAPTLTGSIVAHGYTTERS